ncbi:sulfurtransferase [Paenibacillus woosongensis]|uniref:Thiosulfate sulfurtransferase n=1 Tax=Paenibacillus woosongensis TaxID=307580 RepID=A0ABQ4MX51_9BACL|nr:sulfurtransferase [Paenibacillus woosongensis]GIP60516.1 thiosulfate sulfurtransferase [Paenibacillus woosongensis]
MSNPLVSKKWTLARMYEPNMVIVDCRFQLGAPEAGKAAYAESHIPGAIYLDLENDLSAPIGEHGGRHPLPEPEALAKRLSRAGISNDSVVVAYDDQGGMNASRLWLLLRWLGHDQVYVMDEGFSAWQQNGYPVTTDQHVVIPSSFQPVVRGELIADVEDVRSAIGSPGVLLVDSREAPRYLGQTEPIDAKAGHIPSAINAFWKNNLNAEGKWTSVDQRRAGLSEVIDALAAGREVIVYCGSGVSACPNIVALHSLGYSNVRLYAGSWSDWISYEGNPVATGEE